MPAPLAVDREAVRVLVVAVGPAEAARQMGLPETTVRKWSSRGRWLAHAHPIAAVTSGVTSPAKVSLAATIPPSMRSQPVTGVTSPAQALVETLAELGSKTKLAGAKAVHAALSHASTLEGEEALGASRNTHEAIKGAATLHGWAGDQATIRINMFTGLLPTGEAIERPVLDMESEVIGNDKSDE